MEEHFMSFRQRRILFILKTFVLRYSVCLGQEPCPRSRESKSNEEDSEEHKAYTICLPDRRKDERHKLKVVLEIRKQR